MKLQRRKGMSMVIETVIVLILAVTVMSVLLVFFNYFYTPAQTELGYREQQRQYCMEYQQMNPLCNADRHSSVSRDSPNTLIKIKEACNNLPGYRSCSGGGAADLACVQECCKIYCPITS